MKDALFPLLPAIQRERDAEQGDPLRALLAVVEQELGAVGEDIDGLYADWFVETCADWVVPYIADLLGVRALAPSGDASVTPRAYVANTIRYRRRKGTAAVLELLARDVTGWPARAVESFELLGATQHANHIRPGRGGTADLRDPDRLELLPTPFTSHARTVEVRRVEPRRGRWNIPSVALSLWRLLPVPIEMAPATKVDDRRWRFSQLGADLPLFHRGRPERDPETLASEADLPVRLRRLALWNELTAHRRHGEPLAFLAGGRGASLEIVVDDHVIDPAEMVACDLSDPAGAPDGWRLPPGKLVVDGVARRIRVGFDPELGRLAFPESEAVPKAVEVSYRQGMPARLGGGGYARADELAPVGERDLFVVGSAGLAGALQAWADSGHPPAVVEIADSARHTAPAVTLPAGASLELRAADGQRPVIDLAARWAIALGARSALRLDGLLLAGRGLQVTGGGQFASLELHHCTVVPGGTLRPNGSPADPDAISIAATGAALEISLVRSITGRLATPRELTARLRLRDSIVDGTGGAAAAIAAGTAVVEASTVIGAVELEAVELASNSIFTEAVVADRRQTGCVRHCHVPLGSRVPRRHRCLPDIPPGADAQERHVRALRVRPIFEAERSGHGGYGTPGYCRLAPGAARELRTGADDEGEIGVYHHLGEPLREAMLRAALDEYLRLGLEAGAFFES